MNDVVEQCRFAGAAYTGQADQTFKRYFKILPVYVMFGYISELQKGRCVLASGYDSSSFAGSGDLLTIRQVLSGQGGLVF